MKYPQGKRRRPSPQQVQPTQAPLASNNLGPAPSITDQPRTQGQFGGEAPSITDTRRPLGQVTESLGNVFGSEAPTLDTSAPASVRVDAPAWMIGVKNAMADRKRLVLKPLDLFAPGTDEKNTAEMIAEKDLQYQDFLDQMNPQTIRIDAAQQRLDEVLAQRPELAEQMKLNPPTQAQLAIAGIASLFNPEAAFEILSQPLQYGLVDQAQRQQLADQQHLSDQEGWRLRLQKATGELNNEYALEETRQMNAQKAFGDMLDYEQAVFVQNALDERERMRIEGRYDLSQMEWVNRLAQETMGNMAAMDREAFKSPEAVAMRIQSALVANGMSAEDASSIAWASTQTPYYRNLLTQAQARVANATADERIATLAPKIQQMILEQELTMAQTAYVYGQIDNINARTRDLGEQTALDYLKYGLDVAKYEQGIRSGEQNNALRAAERVGEFASGRIKSLMAEIERLDNMLVVGGEDIGAERIAEIQGEITAKKREIESLNSDIDSATKVFKGVLPQEEPWFKRMSGAVQNATRQATGGGAASRGGFRSVDTLGPGVESGKFLLAGRFPVNLDLNYVYGACPETGDGKGTDCGGFIGYAIRNAVAGADRNFPKKGTSLQEQYIKQNLGRGWAKVNPQDVQIGDIIYTRSGASPSGRHVVMVSGFQNGRPVYVNAQGKRTGVRTTGSLPGAILGIYRRVG